jgi:hypothetical protein
MPFSKGSMPWNKGVSRPPETRLKISQKRKGQHNSPRTEFKKVFVPWDKGKYIWNDSVHPLLGKSPSKEAREKQSQIMKMLYAEGKLKSPTEGKKMS